MENPLVSPPLCQGHLGASECVMPIDHTGFHTSIIPDDAGELIEIQWAHDYEGSTKNPWIASLKIDRDICNMPVIVYGTSPTLAKAIEWSKS